MNLVKILILAIACFVVVFNTVFVLACCVISGKESRREDGEIH